VRPTAPPAIPSLLLLSGDSPLPRETEAAFYDVVELEGVSHTMFWDAPDRCAATILDWLQSRFQRPS
jgi:pimeloyl-ACP methyl ester carboxylesterase